MAILVTKWFGVFLIDERSHSIVDKRLMPKDAQVVAEKLAAVQRGGILDEERESGTGDSPNSVSLSCSTHRSSPLRSSDTTMRSCTRS